MSVADLLDAQVLTDRQPAVALVDAGRPVGLLTLEQIRAVPLDDRATATLGAFATPMSEVPVASPEARITELIPRLGPGGWALVVEDGRLVGLVGPVELARAAEHARPIRAGGRRG
jgi:CBS domain-containing protein